MSQEIEIILTRHWGSLLKVPVFLVDAEGNLIYSNEAAEPLLGQPFSQIGDMSANVWSTAFKITDADGLPLEPSELPLTIALTERRLAYRDFWATALDNVRRHIETACVPLISADGRLLGAVALFWEIEE